MAASTISALFLALSLFSGVVHAQNETWKPFKAVGAELHPNATQPKEFVRSPTFLTDTLLLGTDGNNGRLDVYNVSDPAHPTIVASAQDPSVPQASILSRDKSTVWQISTGEHHGSWLTTFDVTNAPAAIKELGSTETRFPRGRSFTRAADDDGFLFAGNDYPFALDVYDVRNRTQPQRVASVRFPAPPGPTFPPPGKIAHVNGFVFGPYDNVFNVTNPMKPTLANLPILPDYVTLDVAGISAGSPDGTKLAHFGDGSLKIFDASGIQAGKPLKLLVEAETTGQIPCDGLPVWILWSEDGYIFLGCRFATMIDARQLVEEKKKKLKVIASTQPMTMQNALDATVKGKFLYVSFQFEGLRVLTWS